MNEKMWGGRFSESGGRQAEKFTASIGFDRRLWRQDVAGSMAHARMLGKVGVLDDAEVRQLVDGLNRVAAELEAGTFPFRVELEDIHLNIERRLTEIVGPVGGKLHTARSRNDQVALDMHLYVKETESELIEGVRGLQQALRDQAKSALDARIIMPGFTHLQHAQPVPLALHWMAYWHMLERDVTRLAEARARVDRSPLGAAALAGSSFPLEPAMVAKDLGLAGVYANSMDAVSDRDFVLDLLAAGAILMVHLSRLGEELVLWSSREFAFVEIDDAFATGSSIMPQKKNPDVAELVRGKAGRVFGDLMTLLSVLKGLPLAYHSDMQEDKEACFDAVDTLVACLDAMTGMVATLKPRADRMRAALVGDWSGTTDLADALAKRGMPFREAHGVAGSLVRVCGERDPAALTDAELRAISPELRREDLAVLDPEGAVAARGLFDRVAEDLG